MTDLTAISNEELIQLHDKAFSKYYRLATRPCGNWHKGMKFTELEKATNRLNEITEEVERRLKGR